MKNLPLENIDKQENTDITKIEKYPNIFYFYIILFICSENKNCIIRCDKLYYRPLEVDSLKGDSSKAIKKLNWKAKYTIKTMIKEMVEIEFKNLNKIDS